MIDSNSESSVGCLGSGLRPDRGTGKRRLVGHSDVSWWPVTSRKVHKTETGSDTHNLTKDHTCGQKARVVFYLVPLDIFYVKANRYRGLIRCRFVFFFFFIKRFRGGSTNTEVVPSFLWGVFIQKQKMEVALVTGKRSTKSQVCGPWIFEKLWEGIYVHKTILTIILNARLGGSGKGAKNQ